ncbi:Tat pathway signal protein [Methylobacterium nigriterrae]|uniref:Tat pathway signal protein n=1 Tax=Methylobacterium nigriterrae TaxID=3127512 RepID=UPI003D66A687
MPSRGVPFHRRNRIGRFAPIAAACLGASIALAAPVLAQDDKPPADASKGVPIKLQLNRLEPAGDSCRTYLLVDNSRGPALKSLKVDLFAFDQEGVAQKRVAVELGPLPDRKTSVKIFDFAGIACPKLGRVLLNDVLACEGGEASREGCLERMETESKAGVPFDR